MSNLLDQRLPIIREHAGKLRAEEIGKLLGISAGNVTLIASTNKISLALPKELKSAKPGRKPTTVPPPTAEQIAIVKQSAGKMPADEVLKLCGLHRDTLRVLAHQLGISLRYIKPKPPKDPAENPMIIRQPKVSPERVTEAELDAASRLLRSHGYRVYLPDPFLYAAQLKRSHKTEHANHG